MGSLVAGEWETVNLHDAQHRRPLSGYGKAPLPVQRDAAAPATHMLVWFLQSGIQVKWSCAEHRLKFGSHHGHWITEVLGWWEND